MLLSDLDLRKEIDGGRLTVDPFEPDMVQPSSIDVRLDRFFRVFDNTKYTHIDPSLQQDELTSLVETEGERVTGFIEKPTLDYEVSMGVYVYNERSLAHLPSGPCQFPDFVLRLIDAGRVARLPRWPFRGRWIVKDLSQFWYSAQQLGVSEDQRRAWLERYAVRRGLPSSAPLRHAIERKAAWIAKHDEKLRAKQPGRNVSIPASPPPR